MARDRAGSASTFFLSSRPPSRSPHSGAAPSLLPAVGSFQTPCQCPALNYTLLTLSQPPGGQGSQRPPRAGPRRSPGARCDSLQRESAPPWPTSLSPSGPAAKTTRKTKTNAGPSPPGTDPPRQVTGAPSCWSPPAPTTSQNPSPRVALHTSDEPGGTGAHLGPQLCDDSSLPVGTPTARSPSAEMAQPPRAQTRAGPWPSRPRLPLNHLTGQTGAADPSR